MLPAEGLGVSLATSYQLMAHSLRVGNEGVEGGSQDSFCRYGGRAFAGEQEI